MFDSSFLARAFVFFIVEIGLHTLILLFRPVAQRAETTVTDCSLRSCVWACFPTGPTLCLDNSNISPLRPRWVKVYACLGVNCHLHFWQNDWGLLCATAVTWGWNGHRIRVSTQSRLWRRKFSCYSHTVMTLIMSECCWSPQNGTKVLQHAFRYVDYSGDSHIHWDLVGQDVMNRVQGFNILWICCLLEPPPPHLPCRKAML